MIGRARDAMAGQQLHQVLSAVWAAVADANRYFAGEAPWALAKTDPQRQGTVLYVTAEVLRQIAILAQPFRRSRPKNCSLCWRCRARSALSPSSAASIGSPPASSCRHRRRYSRVMSKPKHAPHNRNMLVDSHCHLDLPGFRRRA